jgi:YidC/Oxa1 family membrane protein insertase
MDWQRIAYIAGIGALSFILLFKWNEFQDRQEALQAENKQNETLIAAQIPESASNENSNQQAVTVPSEADVQSTAQNSDIPSAPSFSDAPVVNVQPKASNEQLIRVSTDVLDLVIDRVGGDIVQVVLPKHKVTLGGEQGFTLLDRTSTTTYIAQSGLVGANATDTADGRPVFTSQSSNYALEEGQDTLKINLQLRQGEVDITKQFVLQRNNYLVEVNYLINNQSTSNWSANFYGQIKRDDHKPPVAADSGFGVNPYYGAATTTIDEKYRKLNFKDLTKNSEDFSIEGGWVAMVQHYFTSAWVGNKEESNKYFLKKLQNQNMFLMGYIAPAQTVAAGSQGEISSRFYVGPKDIDKLEAIADNLDLTIDFGWLWWIAKPLFHLLDFIHTYIGNWGWSIIVLTIIIKAIFFYPSAMSYRSMAKMRKVGPKMQELKDRFGDDRQKMSQEMMKLYKKEKVNPMGGCLPILIQMPVFIALYWVLMESVEIRHAPFILWIKDLSVMDPYFVFPLLMGFTMWIQQKLNPTPPDPMQAKIMQWMPVIFTFMFLWFPAGLVVYWVTNNTLSIIQQYMITRAIERGDA